MVDQKTTPKNLFNFCLLRLTRKIFDLLNPVTSGLTGLGGLRLRWNPREAAVSVENLFVFECRRLKRDASWVGINGNINQNHMYIRLNNEGTVYHGTLI